MGCVFYFAVVGLKTWPDRAQQTPPQGLIHVFEYIVFVVALSMIGSLHFRSSYIHCPRRRASRQWSDTVHGGKSLVLCPELHGVSKGTKNVTQPNKRAPLGSDDMV